MTRDNGTRHRRAVAPPSAKILSRAKGGGDLCDYPWGAHWGRARVPATLTRLQCGYCRVPRGPGRRLSPHGSVRSGLHPNHHLYPNYTCLSNLPASPTNHRVPLTWKPKGPKTFPSSTVGPYRLRRSRTIDCCPLQGAVEDTPYCLTTSDASLYYLPDTTGRQQRRTMTLPSSYQ